MEEKDMRKRYLSVFLLLALLLIPFAAMRPVVAPSSVWPNLPKIAVNLTAADGTSTYYVSTLSGVPGGYDVYDQNYSGWCVDRSIIMERGVSHFVVLYSSLDGGLPAPLDGIYWNAINYILNHKQGSMMDVQEAIWFFTDGFSPDHSHTNAWAMITGAQANPSFTPSAGDILAIICYNAQGAAHVQNSIIELRVPS
jgi:hypothetical protein